MLGYVIKRLVAMIPVVLGITILVFLLMRAIPGDPVAVMFGDQSAGQGATAAQIARMRHQLGLDEPIPVQYAKWISRIAEGNMGDSLIDGTSVAKQIMTRIPTTFQLAFGSLIVALIVAIPLGAFAAIFKDRFIDRLSLIIASLSVSVPGFWIALMLIVLVSVQLGWLPTSGRSTLGLVDSLAKLGTGNFGPITSYLKHAILPVATLAFGLLAPLVRITRFSLLEVLDADYVRTARAKGLRERSVIVRHALRNSLIPIITVTGVQIAYLLSGTVLIETIFRWNGIGRLAYTSILRLDYPMVQGVILVTGIVFAFVNLITDIIYAFINPSIRYS